MAAPRKKAAKKAPKKVTRYTHDAHDPVTPETGHSDRLVEEEVVSVEMDNGWGDGLDVVRLASERTIVVDMDPAVDPVLLWSGKRTRRHVPVLPLQRNEIVAESRIARIIERAREQSGASEQFQGSLFAEVERELRASTRDKRVEFYTHDEEWRNKLICGDSLEVMESLSRYEGLTGAVQMIYFDPPYGIAYDSNFQQRVDKDKNDKSVDGVEDVLTIRAFRDTWTLGAHSYLSYLSDRLYLARELLAATGSIFVQISDDHVHRVRLLLDEIFGAENFLSEIVVRKRAYQSSQKLKASNDYLLWYAKDHKSVLTNRLYTAREYDPSDTKFTKVQLADGQIASVTSLGEGGLATALASGGRLCRTDYPLVSQDEVASLRYEFELEGRIYQPPAGRHWSITQSGMERLRDLNRLSGGPTSMTFIQYFDEFPWVPISNVWMDVAGERDKVYAVQTAWKVVVRAICLASNPGDLVLDITSGSGTTAYCAERMGRRWIACDSSRVSINVARRRLLGSVFENFELKGETPAEGLTFETAAKVTPSSLAYDREDEVIELVDHPVRDTSAVRVCGPFEVMTIGRYSIEDWRGVATGAPPDASRLENYVEVLCRLYWPEAEVGASSGLLHAISDAETGAMGLSVGPLTGRVTAHQLSEAAKEATDRDLTALHVLGWAFEANVGEVKGQLEAAHDIAIELVMIRPDALARELKVSRGDSLFSPLALPEVRVESLSDRPMVEVILDGVTVYDHEAKRASYRGVASGYVAAWYLDEDYDGDCFVDCQMFFDFKKAPNLKSIAGVEVDAGEYALRYRSDPFEPGQYQRVAVKVVDIYGNESTVVRELAS